MLDEFLIQGVADDDAHTELSSSRARLLEGRLLCRRSPGPRFAACVGMP
jgi:hypothetical protein